MSASPAQIAANRANAQRSTGPRTPEGKAASARNALSHGIHASDDTLLASPNSPAAAYLADFTAEFAPNSPAEAALVRQLALCTARTDLLDRALDAFPRLNQRRALIDCLQDQYDVFGPSAQLQDQPEWSAALRRFDGCPATYPRDPDPATDPDLAACTLVYSLTSPRYARLLRQHAQAGRGFRAALHDLQHLRAARPKVAPPHQGISDHLQGVSDLLERGRQLTPLEGACSIPQNEPNFPTRTDLAHPGTQNEANFAPAPADAGLPSIPADAEAADHPAILKPLRSEANPACTPASTNAGDGAPSRENEPDRTPDPARSNRPAITLSRENEPNSAADLTLLDRLTRHPDQTISEAEWFAACRPPARGISVEAEIAAFRALAKKPPTRRAALPAPAR